MANASVIGWDLGGAHLKAAYLDDSGTVQEVIQLPCPLWQGLQHLEQGVDQAMSRTGGNRICHAVTMTGELVDLFRNRSEGVQGLIGTLKKKLPPNQMRIYAGVAGFVAPSRAVQLVDQVASANWMASAEYVSRCMEQCLFVDVGSTTTDIVIIRGGRVHAKSMTDGERLICEELVYTGVVRTPVMAVAEKIAFDGEWVYPMAEHFATMADIYRIIHLLPEDADQMPTADDAGKSVEESARRLARMLGRDMESASPEAWSRCANHLAELQLQRLHRACDRVLSRGVLDDDAPLVGAGVGRFLVQILAQRMQRRYMDFSETVEHKSGSDSWISICAPAVAVALLMKSGL